MKISALALLLMSGSAWAVCSSSHIPVYRLKNDKVVDKGTAKQHFCISSNSMAEGWDFKSYQTTLFKSKAKKSTRSRRAASKGGTESYKVNRKNAAFIGQVVQGKMMRCLVFGRNEMLCTSYPPSSLKNKLSNSRKKKHGKSRRRR